MTRTLAIRPGSSSFALPAFEAASRSRAIASNLRAIVEGRLPLDVLPQLARLAEEGARWAALVETETT